MSKKIELYYVHFVRNDEIEPRYFHSIEDCFTFRDFLQAEGYTCTPVSVFKIKKQGIDKDNIIDVVRLMNESAHITSIDAETARGI